jgi:hypothetical protein
MKKRETVLDNLCSECKQAFLSGNPIIYILTDEIELIGKLIDSDILTPQYIRIPDVGIEYASKYKSGLKKIYQALKVKKDNNTYTLQIVASECKISEAEACKYLLAYLQDGTKINRIKFINDYERHYDSMMPQIINSKSFSYTQGNPVFDADSINDMEPMLQVWWNYKESEETNKLLHRYVKEYENSPMNSIYRQSTLLICASDYKLYNGLNNYVSVIEVKLPDDWEIKNIIEEFITEYEGMGIKSKEYLNALVTAFKGYNRSQIRKLLSGILLKAKNDINRYDAIADIRKDKKQLVKKSEILELVELEEDDVKVGGQEALLSWIRKQKNCLINPKENSNTWGTSVTKGVLVCGIPGTGKSLAAKQAALASELD